MSIGEIKSYNQSYIFNDITKNLKTKNSNYCTKQSIKPDSVEIKKKAKIQNNKLLKYGLILAGIAVGVVLLRKNITKVPEEITINTKNTENVNRIQEKLTEKAKRFLIDDMKKTGLPSAGGVCFYGPDSHGKEAIFEGFINNLEEAGYKIERAPRAGEKKLEEIGEKITELINQAEQRYKDLKQNTAIIVRDLDTLAPNRESEAAFNITGNLLGFEKCREKGFIWVSEAKDITKVDPAVKRAGRIDHSILAQPSAKDSLSAWNKYVEIINKFTDSGKKNELLKHASEQIAKKG